jgi:hypothetical protein
MGSLTYQETRKKNQGEIDDLASRRVLKGVLLWLQAMVD